jgi:hypothetical protein
MDETYFDVQNIDAIVNSTAFNGRPFTKETVIYSSPSIVLFFLALLVSIAALIFYHRRKNNYVQKRRKMGSAFNETAVAELLMDERIYSAGIAHSFSTTSIASIDSNDTPIVNNVGTKNSETQTNHLSLKQQEESRGEQDNIIDDNIDMTKNHFTDDREVIIRQDDHQNITVTFSNYGEEDDINSFANQKKKRVTSTSDLENLERVAGEENSGKEQKKYTEKKRMSQIYFESALNDKLDNESMKMTRSLSLPSWTSFTDLKDSEETKMVSHHYKVKRREKVTDPVEKIRQENRDFLDTNKRAETELSNYLLKQLNDGEQLYWADVPLYSYKHGKTVRNALIFIIMSMCLSLIFGIISAFIAPVQNALVISLMGVVACAIPLAAGIYYTISLRGLNIMYSMTNDRIIFCRRKGFLRNRFVHASYRYENIDINNIIHKEYLPEVSKKGRTYGNLFFAKDSSVATDEWKLDPNSTHNRIGFRAILSVDEVEEILLLKIELKHRELTNK